MQGHIYDGFSFSKERKVSNFMSFSFHMFIKRSLYLVVLFSCLEQFKCMNLLSFHNNKNLDI